MQLIIKPVILPSSDKSSVTQATRTAIRNINNAPIIMSFLRSELLGAPAAAFCVNDVSLPGRSDLTAFN